MDNPRHVFIRGDICDARTVERAMSGCDAVVNFAAETHVDRSIADSGAFLKSNYMGVSVLLETARKLKTGRFLQVSTDEVYGSIRKGVFTEDSPLAPGNPYSASKAAADLLVLS